MATHASGNTSNSKDMHSKIKKLKLDSNTLSLRQLQIVVGKNNSVPNAQ